jgi:hypothetical protein
MLHLFLKNVLHTICHKLQEDSGTSGFDLFMVGKAQESHGGEIWTVWQML